MTKLAFAKYHGLGNDFILINGLESLPRVDSQTASAWCKRRFGIGADGVIIVLPSQRAACRMLLFNADGSEAAMCGNGLRCLALFARDEGLISAESYSVETPAGLMQVKLDRDAGGRVRSVTAHMGQPRLLAQEVPTTLVPGDQAAIDAPMTIDGKTWHVTAMRMGARHCVVFVPLLDGLDVGSLGPAFEHHPTFPQRTNVMFTQVVDRGLVRVTPWERGVGATQACGTGACAAAVAGVLTGQTERNVQAALPGGVLRVCWDEASNQVTMSGPAARVFEGYIE